MLLHEYGKLILMTVYFLKVGTFSFSQTLANSTHVTSLQVNEEVTECLIVFGFIC